MLLYFLPGIVILGILTTITDIKKSKILNKHLIIALSYGIIVYLLLFFRVFNKPDFLDGNYILSLIINAVIALVLGFLLWHFGLWSEGDGKLFFVYSFLIPLTTYKYGYFNYFPSLSFMINTFLPMFCFLFFYMIVKTSWNNKKKFFLKKFKTKPTIKRLVLLSFIFWTVQSIFRIIGEINIFFSIFISILLYVSLRKLLENINLYYVIIALIPILVLDRNIYSINFLIGLLNLFIIWVFLITIILDFGSETFSKKIKIKNLKEGMIPLPFKLNKTSFFEKKSKSLNKYDIKNIKNVAGTKLINKTIRVKSTIPFAPLLFLGAVITFIVQGNLVNFLIYTITNYL